MSPEVRESQPISPVEKHGANLAGLIDDFRFGVKPTGFLVDHGIRSEKRGDKEGMSYNQFREQFEKVFVAIGTDCELYEYESTILARAAALRIGHKRTVANIPERIKREYNEQLSTVRDNSEVSMVEYCKKKTTYQQEADASYRVVFTRMARQFQSLSATIHDEISVEDTSKEEVFRWLLQLHIMGEQLGDALFESHTKSYDEMEKDSEQVKRVPADDVLLVGAFAGEIKGSRATNPLYSAVGDWFVEKSRS